MPTTPLWINDVLLVTHVLRGKFTDILDDEINRTSGLNIIPISDALDRLIDNKIEPRILSFLQEILSMIILLSSVGYQKGCILLF